MRHDVARILEVAHHPSDAELLAANTEDQPSLLGTAVGYAKTTTDLDMEELLEHHPRLHNYGYGDMGDGNAQSIDLLTSRDGRALINYVRLLLPVTVKPIQKVTRRSPGSYSSKGLYEEAIGRYITNGQFIAALLLEPVIPVKVDEPNVWFGVDSLDFQHFRKLSLG